MQRKGNWSSTKHLALIAWMAKFIYMREELRLGWAVLSPKIADWRACLRQGDEKRKRKRNKKKG
jgi:hypothetical protein